MFWTCHDTVSSCSPAWRWRSRSAPWRCKRAPVPTRGFPAAPPPPVLWPAVRRPASTPPGERPLAAPRAPARPSGWASPAPASARTWSDRSSSPGSLPPMPPSAVASTRASPRCWCATCAAASACRPPWPSPHRGRSRSPRSTRWWRARTAQQPGSRRPPRSAPAKRTVELHRVDAHGQSLLDFGTTIAPRSLRLHGRTLTWLHAGQTRSSTLS